MKIQFILPFLFICPFLVAQSLPELDASLNKLHTENGFSGIISVKKENEILVQKSYGYRDFEEELPINTNTKFNLGSITKVFTAVAAIQILNKHQISLDQKIGKYLPEELKGIGLDNITFLHLFTHRSGLGSYLMNPVYRDNFEEYVSIQSFLKKELFELSFDPGSSFQYSNTAVLLLGILIEQIEETAYYNLIQKLVFDRAKMKDSGFFSSDELVSNRAKGYYEENGAMRSNYFRHSIKGSPAGGSYSSAQDMHLFYDALYNGKLISKDLVNQLIEPRFKNTRSRNPNSYVGLIFSVDKKDGHFGHSGGSIGISCSTRYYPKQDLTVVILQNYESSRATRRIVEKHLGLRP